MTAPDTSTGDVLPEPAVFVEATPEPVVTVPAVAPIVENTKPIIGALVPEMRDGIPTGIWGRWLIIGSGGIAFKVEM